MTGHAENNWIFNFLSTMWPDIQYVNWALQMPQQTMCLWRTVLDAMYLKIWLSVMEKKLANPLKRRDHS